MLLSLPRRIGVVRRARTPHIEIAGGIRRDREKSALAVHAQDQHSIAVLGVRQPHGPSIPNRIDVVRRDVWVTFG